MRIAFFLSIVISLFTILGIYLFTRMEQIFPASIMSSKITLAVYIFILIAFFLGKISERYSINFFSDVLIRIGAIAAGFFVFGIFSIIFFDILRGVNTLIPFFPDFITSNYAKSKLIIGIGTFGFISIIMINGFLNTTNPKIKTLELDINRPQSSLKELNIVAVSDIHLGTMVNHKKARRLVNMINELKPDVVLIGGDIIDDNIKVVQHYKLVEHFKNIDSKYGVYSCLGNHEYISGAQKELNYFEENGIRILIDTAVTIDGKFNIIGRDDIQGQASSGIPRKSIAELQSEINNHLPTLLIDHQPYKLEESSQAGIDFQFSGHTHNGQFWPLNYITGMIFEQDWGYLKKNNSHFYISSGYGTAVIPIRLGNDSEVMNIKLRNI